MPVPSRVFRTIKGHGNNILVCFISMNFLNNEALTFKSKLVEILMTVFATIDLDSKLCSHYKWCIKKRNPRSE